MTAILRLSRVDRPNSSQFPINSYDQKLVYPILKSGSALQTRIPSRELYLPLIMKIQRRYYRAVCCDVLRARTASLMKRYFVKNENKKYICIYILDK